MIKRTLYWNNGNIKSEFVYIEGNLHGKRLTYYYNGELKCIEIYVDGKKHGKQTRYWSDGENWYNYMINGKDVSEEEWILYSRLEKLKKITVTLNGNI